VPAYTNAYNNGSFRNLIFFLFLLRWTRKALLQLKGRGLFGTFADAYIAIRRSLYGLFLRAPGVRSQVQKQVAEAITKLQSKLVPSGPGITRYLTLPKEGWSEETVLKELDTLATMDHTRWEDGYVSGAVYHGGDSLMKLQTEAFGKFTVANPIHPDVFPGVRKMEAEIVSMVLGIFNAPAGAAGVTTSGGTESILMACLSARQKAYAERGVTEPEMYDLYTLHSLHSLTIIRILPETGHTAFRKAGEYFGIKIHLVTCPAPSYQVHIPSVARLINSNTVLLVGSAPNFPHGIIDDISSLSKLAVKRRIPLHVDCCLGSFLVPFLEKAGFETELFDFRLKGVTSISCDTHKYGFAPKGNSTCLYRTASLRAYQYFISPDWSGGVYASPSIAGSRPGALIAGCWASLMSVGEAGYIKSCSEIVGATKKIIESIQDNPALNADLEVMGHPLVSVVAFTSKTLDIYDIADAMSGKGWHLNSLQTPPAIHVAVTLPIVKVWEKLVADLEAVIEGEKEKERVRIVEGKGAKGKSVGDSAALYGVAGSLPNKSVVVELASGFLDTLYKA
jgi:sphinganine-1-phosphate aldolase